MEDLGEEDLQDTDMGAGAIGLSTTTAATIIRKTAWEQTILALQQLGVSCQSVSSPLARSERSLKSIISTLHSTSLHPVSGQVIVFVALLVGGGFVTMVWIELALGWVWEKVSDSLGNKKVKDPENPAALVGSFKRYK